MLSVLGACIFQPHVLALLQGVSGARVDPHVGGIVPVHCRARVNRSGARAWSWGDALVGLVQCGFHATGVERHVGGVGGGLGGHRILADSTTWFLPFSLKQGFKQNFSLVHWSLATKPNLANHAHHIISQDKPSWPPNTHQFWRIRLPFKMCPTLYTCWIQTPTLSVRHISEGSLFLQNW